MIIISGQRFVTYLNSSSLSGFRPDRGRVHRSASDSKIPHYETTSRRESRIGRGGKANDDTGTINNGGL
jgi:hypothetical protein